MRMEMTPALVAVPDQTESLQSAPRLRRGITVEHVLYGVILLLALGARFFALGSILYTSQEAAATWPAWLDAMALQVTNAPQPSSALLHTLQTALFWLFAGGGSDAAGNLLGRLPVALAGAVIVLLPWWWRDLLSRRAALALALLLAFDPWLLALSRIADSAMLSTACALTALTALHVALRPAAESDAPAHPARASAVAAVALGLLPASGVQAWPWLAVVATYALLAHGQNWRTLATPRTLLLFVAALVLGATTLLAQPEMLRVISASLGIWLQRFAGGEYGLGWLLLRLIVDSPLLVMAGILGILQVWTSAPNDVRPRLWLTLWLAWGSLLLLAPGRSPQDFALFATALAVFAAIAIGEVADALMHKYRASEWFDANLLGAVLGILVLGLLFWGTSTIWNREWSSLDGSVTIGFLLLAVALVAVFAMLISGRQALLVALVVVGVVLLGSSISSAYKLTSAPRPAFPNGFFAETVYPDLHHLPEDVRTLSDRRKGDNTELAVLVINDATRTPDPLLGWTLRSMRNLRFVDSWQVTATYANQVAPLVITQGEETIVGQWNQYYLGSPYRTTVRWLPESLPSLLDRPEGSNFWTQSGRAWLRWMLLREATPAVPSQVNLWATAQ